MKNIRFCPDTSWPYCITFQIFTYKSNNFNHICTLSNVVIRQTFTATTRICKPLANSYPPTDNRIFASAYSFLFSGNHRSHFVRTSEIGAINS